MTLKVLVACEESQAVCKAFREFGHEAYSCDIQECSGGHSEWHIKGNALDFINGHDVCRAPFPLFRTQDGKYHDLPKRWDLIIAHPPCTYLSNAGARWLWAGHELNKERYAKGLDAKEFFMKFWNADCPRICIENPVPSSVYNLPDCTQFVQPYEYGHPYSKKTCLWLKGLPPLKPTEIIADHKPFVSSGNYSKTHDPKYKGASRRGGSAKSRSKTFPGIAKAIAEQFGRYIEEEWKNA